MSEIKAVEGRLENVGNIKNNSKVILDARSYKRFIGEAKEPRPGLQSGHIPNSKSLPSSELKTCLYASLNPLSCLSNCFS